MTYWDLLGQAQYFNRFLAEFNIYYRNQVDGKGKESNYKALICRYYNLRPDGSGNPSAGANVTGLIDDNAHISNVWESLIEFGYNTYRPQSERISPCKFKESIQEHRDVIIRLASYRMDCISPNAVPQQLLEDLKYLFDRLEVVLKGKSKLVYVSKTLHFLLPDLVMPVDNEIVLPFLRKKKPPREKEFELFKEIFEKYIELAQHLGLKRNNGDGEWWNISVPKRIDNAMDGFRRIFNDDNKEHIICDHIDMLLSYFAASQSSQSSPRAKPRGHQVQNRSMKQSLPIPRKALEAAKKYFGKQPFSRSQLYKETEREYGKINRDSFLTADWSVNEISGYEFDTQKREWSKRHPYFFKRYDGLFEIYDAVVHGTWTRVDSECRRIN